MRSQFLLVRQQQTHYLMGIYGKVTASWPHSLFLLENYTAHFSYDAGYGHFKPNLDLRSQNTPQIAAKTASWPHLRPQCWPKPSELIL
jgi:hypothetical protein